MGVIKYLEYSLGKRGVKRLNLGLFFYIAVNY